VRFALDYKNTPQVEGRLEKTFIHP